LSPRGNVHPFVHPQGWIHTLLFRRMEGRTENFTPGDNFNPRGQKSALGDKNQPWGTTSPLGSKFAPRGQVNNGPRMLPKFLVLFVLATCYVCLDKKYWATFCAIFVTNSSGHPDVLQPHWWPTVRSVRLALPPPWLPAPRDRFYKKTRFRQKLKITYKISLKNQSCLFNWQ
jgi:hypothetical protein